MYVCHNCFILYSYEIDILIRTLSIRKIAFTHHFLFLLIYRRTIDHISHNPLVIEKDNHINICAFSNQIDTRCLNRHVILITMVSNKKKSS